MTFLPKLAVSVRQRRSVLVLAAGFLFLVINFGFVVAVSRTATPVLTPASGASTGVTQATHLPDGQVVVATNDNQVLLLRDGSIVESWPSPYLISAVSAISDGTVIFVGTSDGKVTTLDATLHQLTQVSVAGRVVGLEASADNGFFVAHGTGPFSDRYWIAFFPHGQAKPTYDHKVEFTISALAVSKDRVFYSTANGRMGALRAGDGSALWSVTATRPVSQMGITPDAVLLGDDRGNLTLLDRQTGQKRWSLNVTASPIRSIGTDPSTGLLLAGDDAGAIFVLNSLGQIVYQGKTAESFVRVFLSGPTGITVIPQDGSWLLLRPGAIQGAATAGSLRLGWAGVNIVLLVAAVVTLTIALESWRHRAIAFGAALRRSRTGLLLVTPALLLIVIFQYYPAGMALYYSFTSFSLSDVTKFVGLENYRVILSNDYYFRVGIGNLLLILASGILKAVTVPLLVAELIFWIRNERTRYAFRIFAIFPAVVPSLVTVYLWRLIYDPNEGALNQFLGAIGQSSLQRAWLGDEKTAIWAIIGAGFPYLGAFAFLIFMGGLLNINTELYDAAQIDGADWLRRFRQIDLPLLTPQFRLLLFFAFAGAIQDFAGIFVLTGGGPGNATYVPALEMFMRISTGEFGYANAIGVLLFLTIFIGTVGILRFRRDVAVEAA